MNSPIRQYLLGLMSDDDAQQFEADCFSNDDRFSEMLGEEDALIEEYLSGRLTRSEHERFEERFLSTEWGKQKIAIATALARGRDWSGRRAEPARWRWLAVAAALMLALVGAATLREFVTMRAQISALKTALARQVANEERLRARALAPQIAVPAIVHSLIIQSGERGAPSSSTILLSRGAATAEVWLILPQSRYPAYAATVQTVEGRAIWSATALSPQPINGQSGLLLRIPAAVLEANTFIVSVSGERPGTAPDPVEDYSFTVRRL